MPPAIRLVGTGLKSELNSVMMVIMLLEMVVMLIVPLGIITVVLLLHLTSILILLYAVLHVLQDTILTQHFSLVRHVITHVRLAPTVQHVTAVRLHQIALSTTASATQILASSTTALNWHPHVSVRVLHVLLSPSARPASQPPTSPALPVRCALPSSTTAAPARPPALHARCVCPGTL